MEDRSLFAQRVSDRLRRAGFGPLAAALLEAMSPISLLGAQLGYLMEPLVGRPEVGEFSRLLEDRESVDDLVRRLREEDV
jgi:hypothetical protein